jgi:hypothetical protein
MESRVRVHTSRTRLSEIMSALSGDAGSAMRRFVAAVKPPIDASGESRVITSAGRCLAAFRSSLSMPSPVVDELIARLDVLNNGIAALCLRPVILLNETMWRQLYWRPQWALFRLLDGEQIPVGVRRVVGAELARSLILGKPFDKALATGLRSHIVVLTGAPDHPMPIDLKKKCDSITRAAVAMCSGAGAEVAAEEPIDDSLRRYFDGRVKYAGNKEHQGVLDARCQTASQVVRSAAEVRRAVAAGDERALLIVIAICTGLPLTLVRRLPLLSRITGDWNAAVDIESGLYKMSLGLIVPDKATPRAGASGLVVAQDILVRPLPRFLLDALAERSTRWPTATTIGALLPAQNLSGRAVLGAMPTGGVLAPTVARLLNSIGRFALGIGLNRLMAAYATGDYRLIPRSKLHYAVVDRQDLWAASTQVYEALGWGPAVAMEHGPAMGSCITPTRETVAQWWHWMGAEVSARHPGSRAALDRLIDHHNVFARACASAAAFLLAMRKRVTIDLPSTQSIGEGWVTQMQDKRVGPFPDADPVPVCAILAAQLDLWHRHCAALDARLAGLGFAPEDAVRARLGAELAQGARASFFVVDEDGLPVPVSSAKLADWWPTSLGLEANCGRHFWETNLPKLGLTSREADAFVRHHHRGMFAWTNDSDFILSAWVRRCSAAQDGLLQELGCQPIRGLGRRGGK